MADRIQFDGKTFIPLIEGAGMAGVSEKEVMTLAQSGHVFLRAIGKKVYVDIVGLQDTVHAQQSAPVGEPVALPTVLHVGVQPSPIALVPLAPKALENPFIATALKSAPNNPVQSPVAHAATISPTIVTAPLTSVSAQPKKILPHHLSSAELSALAPIEISAPVLQDVRSSSTQSLPNSLPRIVLPPQQLAGGIGRSFATSAAALAAFIFVIGGSIVLYENKSVLARFIGNVGEQVAAAVSFGNTASYEAASGTSGNSPIENGPSEIQARAHASTIPAATSSAAHPIYYVYNYPVIERVRTEVKYIDAENPQDFAQQLDALYQRIQSQIQGLNITTNTQFAQQYQVIAQTNNIDKLGGVTIGENSTFSGGTVTGSTLTDIASLAVSGGTTLGGLTVGDITASGGGTFSGAGIFSYLTASSTSATSTFNGALLATRAPTIPHTFSSWTTGAVNSGAFDAALVINPSSAVADSNLFSAMVNGSVKFLVDVEGDVFVNNLTSVGSVTLSTTSASTFTVEGNTTLGDSITDTTTINGTLVVSGTTTASTISGKFGVGTTTPWAKLAVQATAGQTYPIFEVASSSSGTAYLTVSSSGNVDISSTLTVGNLTSSGNVSLGNATTTNLFSTTASSTNLFSTSATFGSLSVLGALSQTGLGTFQNGFVSQASSTVVGAFTTTGTNTFGGALNIAGAITSTATSANTFPYASSTAITVSGTGYFGTASSTNLTISSLTSGRVPFITTAGAFTDSSAFAFDSSLARLTVTNASTTALSVSGNAYFAGSGIWNSSGNVGIGTTSPSYLLTVEGNTNGAITSAVRNWSSGTSAQARFLALADAGNATLGFTSTGYTDVTGAADSLLLNTSGASGGIQFALDGVTKVKIDSAGNLGVGTTSPFRMLSVTSAVATAQAALSYDTTRNTDFLTDSVGDLTINPSGDDVRVNDDNLWVCSGGSCPSGTPSGTGNLIVETKIGIGSSTPMDLLSISGTPNPRVRLNDSGGSAFQLLFDNSDAYLDNAKVGKNFVFRTSNSSALDTTAITILSSGKVGIGTTTPTDMLSVHGLLRVGANSVAPVTLGTATSTFNGDIKILGKLDVGTIDPVYTISGIKYATYGHSTVGIKEEAVLKISMQQWDPKSGLYRYNIDFDELERGTDLWLFYQITDFGKDWKNLIVSLTPAFNGFAFYEEDIEKNAITIYSSQEGHVSARFIANRFDFSKWANLRPDQDGDSAGTHVIEEKR